MSESMQDQLPNPNAPPSQPLSQLELRRQVDRDVVIARFQQLRTEVIVRALQRGRGPKILERIQNANANAKPNPLQLMFSQQRASSAKMPKHLTPQNRDNLLARMQKNNVNSSGSDGLFSKLREQSNDQRIARLKQRGNCSDQLLKRLQKVNVPNVAS